ncbi:MAG: GntR family transcriptional regulator [Solirubrobacteraceae bacterium]|nr:GntR family transcriptional regulator [Solirubrobacteraceae bacterium]
MATTEHRPLVDHAEQALRQWLSPGRHRAGDRLPPEHDLAAMLGVSRGTLRAALSRLEETGEVVRRQGSGTYVGSIARRRGFSDGLEVLESYALLAERQGIELAVRALRIEHGDAPRDAAVALELEPGARATTVERTLVADGEPVAFMRDVLHPSISLPDAAKIAAGLEQGRMVLDLLPEFGVPVAFAKTHVRPRLLGGDDPASAALDITEPTAVLELMEVMHLPDGRPVQCSADVFAPGGLHIHVMRLMAAPQPENISPST